MSPENDSPQQEKAVRTTGFRFLLRGLAISLPSILTIVILLWVGRGINDYIIQPTSLVVRYTIARFIDDSRPKEGLVEWDRLPELEYCGTGYLITKQLRQELIQRSAKNLPQDARDLERAVPVSWVRQQVGAVYVPFGVRAVPYSDYLEVAKNLRPSDIPNSATALYMELVVYRHFQGLFHLSAVAVVIVVAVFYFLGRFVTVHLGDWMVKKFESQVLGRLPVVSNLYSSVKQVTDFFFSERQIEYNRVVAIEYPRRGVWALGFVTSSSMLELTAAAGEPLLSILIPTSPMPMTGFTVNVPRSDVIDLNITVDQAVQYFVSCGVLVPPQQAVTSESLQKELAKRFRDADDLAALRRKAMLNNPDVFAPPHPNASQQSTMQPPEETGDSSSDTTGEENS